MREREPWERLRLLANVVAHCVTGNDLNMTLPWEMPTKEEQAASLEEAIAAAKMMEAMVAAGDLKGLKG